MVTKSHLDAMDLTYWKLKKDTSLHCAPERVFNHLEQIDILCLCPESWRNNQKIIKLVINFTKYMFNKEKVQLVYLADLSENIEKYEKYPAELIINFSQNACQNIASLIKIDGAVFEAILERAELKKRVMLDVFRNRIFNNRYRLSE
ncbi:hypothetical protein L3V79_05360 [Thiotrichales bacterium 19S9-12]|nr:hypothetical protein [Thiotrichales bacterium 19S9-11]MCF6811786.1 hypothetical protein [Thiotrichales bacterium 19S9-12]